MAYINCEQDHIDNDIRNIFIKKKKKKNEEEEAMNTNISIKRGKKKTKKKNTRMKLNTYLHECTLRWKNTLEIKEIFSLRSKIFHLKKVVLKTKFSRTSLT